MGAEIGATTSTFGYDESMGRYLRATGRDDVADEAEKVKDRQLMLKCIGEVRSQIKLAADIQLSMFTLEEALRFMAVVKEALKHASPDAYQEFRRLINNERSIRAALRFA